MKRRTLMLGMLGLLGSTPTAAQLGPQLEVMGGRSIGPAGMSGRVAAVAVVHDDPTIMFVGAATGGVWRSKDGGVTWQSVFDGQPVLSIGAIAINQSNPDIVWVGTGEGNPRNSMGVGYGVFKSLDGGDTWTHLGLERSEHIHRIRLDPGDPAVAYVAAMGPAWSDGGDRGVFRTRDGGQTWESVLSGNDRTGAAELIMDPSNPDKLIAALWDYRRWPWFFESGGPGSGIHVTYDGGDSWMRLTEDHGLPAGELGRVGLAIAESDPNVVYALVEASRSELLRSEDGGRTWSTISDRDGVANRPFYYADIRVDPQNENRLYSLSGRIEVSEDQGRSFRLVVPSAIIHGDVQELWIDPTDSRFMIMGNDGGIGISRDRGDNWRFVENLALAQFYHISVDDAVPYNVYGGLQDNGSWFGPNTVWETRGIANGHWRRVGGGDGFSVMPDPSDARYGYSMSQGGNLQRFDKVTGERRSIRPVHPDGIPLRFNWNAALSSDPHDPAVLYLASQFVHRTRDGGASWEIVSEDLTTNDPEKQRADESGGLTLDTSGAEMHTTVLSVRPSPSTPGLIWASTDDGRVHVTRDDGATWTEVGGNLPGVPDATWVPHVEPSHHDDATAYVVLDDHRRGNWAPYVFRTQDFGASWTPLATSDLFGFAHVIREDPIEPRLLFLGTEFGLYVSVDHGASWVKWSSGVPPAPIRDAQIHPRDHDLVLGTHGRGIYVVDDIRPLRAIASNGGPPNEPVTVFDPPPAYTHVLAEGIGYRSTGHAMFFGERRPYGALLSYWVADGAGGAATVSVRDSQSRLVSRFEGSATAGLNRTTWDLTMAGDSARAEGLQGLDVVPGNYTVTVTVGDDSSTKPLTVLSDPNDARSTEERVANLEARRMIQGWVEVGNEARDRLGEALSALDQILVRLESAELTLQGEALQAELTRLNEELFTGPECQGSCGGDPVMDRVSAGGRGVRSSSAAPGQNDQIAMAQARAALEEIVDRVNGAFEDEISAYSDALRSAGFTLLPGPPNLEVPR